MENSIKYKIINLKEPHEWNAIVKSFENYDVHYLFEYNLAFENEKNEPAFLYYYNYLETRAIYVFIKRDIYYCGDFHNYITKATYFDIISPYGYGGFIIEGNNVDDVFYI